MVRETPKDEGHKHCNCCCPKNLTTTTDKSVWVVRTVTRAYCLDHKLDEASNCVKAGWRIGCLNRKPSSSKRANHRGSDLLQVTIVLATLGYLFGGDGGGGQTGAGAMRGCGAIYRADDGTAPDPSLQKKV